MRNLLCVLAIFAMVFGFVASASAAGGDGTTGPSLGGNLYLSGYNGYPNFGTNDNSYGTNADGSFYINLDGSTVSLQSANWQFNAPMGNSSGWSATCNLQGLLNAPSTDYNKNWSTSYSNSAGMSISANTNVYCYDQNAGQISSLADQVAQYQAQIAANPNGSSVPVLKLEIQIDQIQEQLLTLNDPKVLSINGNMDVNPSSSTGSNFQYWESTETVYSYPNGYNGSPVVTSVPIWNAEYEFYGTLLGGSSTNPSQPVNQYALPDGVTVVPVPEPSTFALIGIGIFGIGAIVWRRNRR